MPGMTRIKTAQLTLSMGQGGIENLILSMLEYQNSVQFETCVICLDSGGELLDRARLMGISCNILSRKPGFDLALIWRLTHYLRRERIQIVHTHNQTAHFYGCLAARLAGVPVVVNTEHSRFDLEGYWRRRVEKRFLSRFTDLMIAVSEDLKLASKEKDKISAEKTAVIENGVDLIKFSSACPADVAAVKESINIPQGARIVSIVARLHPIKNHSMLLEAISIARSFIPELYIMIIGEGEMREDLENQAKELGIRDRVFFLGNRHDIPVLMKASDILVLCSKNEGLPLVVLEGMAAGRPLIVTEGANSSGLLQDGVNGFVCNGTAHELATKICSVLSSRESVDKVVEFAQKEASENYSIFRTVRRYEEIYLNLLNRRCAFHLNNSLSTLRRKRVAKND